MKIAVHLGKVTEPVKLDGLLRVAYRKGKKLFVQSIDAWPAERFKVEHGENGEVCLRFRLAEDEALSIGATGGVASKKEIEGK